MWYFVKHLKLEIKKFKNTQTWNTQTLKLVQKLEMIIVLFLNHSSIQYLFFSDEVIFDCIIKFQICVPIWREIISLIFCFIIINKSHRLIYIQTSILILNCILFLHRIHTWIIQWHFCEIYTQFLSWKNERWFCQRN